jgi:hypothetical protein
MNDVPNYALPVTVQVREICQDPIRIGDIHNLQSLELVQLVATSRSGSFMLQAYFDEHPEVLQVPGIFKFYDFRADNPTILSEPEGFIAAAVANFNGIRRLFDSSGGEDGLGHLGPNRDQTVQVDRLQFEVQLKEVLFLQHAIAHLTWDSLLRSIVIAYAHTAGLPWKNSKVILQHLHHGDWLFPELLIDDYNLMDRHGRIVEEPEPRPSRLLITSRADTPSAFRSCLEYAFKSQAKIEDALHYRETLLRLLAQDLVRLSQYKQSYPASLEVNLEALKADLDGQLERISRWLGVSHIPSPIRSMTFFGLTWWGDVNSTPSATPRVSPTTGASRLSIADQLYYKAICAQPDVVHRSIAARMLSLATVWLLRADSMVRITSAWRRKWQFVNWQGRTCDIKRDRAQFARELQTLRHKVFGQ